MSEIQAVTSATRPARSWLFVPATRPERFEKAAASGADRVIVDLEDAVAPEAKVAARRGLAEVALPSKLPVYLRINGPGTEWFDEDLAAAASLPFAGVVVPKAESAPHLSAISSRLPPGRALIAIIESAAGLEQIHEVARAAGVERLAFGSVDFQLDVGGRDGEELHLAFARSRIVIASRVAGLAAPIDGPSLALDDDAAVIREADHARRFGFAGKLCIHPRQIAAVHRAFAPSDEDVAWARGLLEALAARPAEARGAFSYRGTMVDRPVVERARQILSVVTVQQTAKG
jgi:citrate lyase subunit beta/citryl-CoA lyase